MNLITGNKGYIGSHFMPEPLEGWTGCDLKDGQDYRSIKGETFETVIHLAASVSVTESFEKQKAYLENNALGVAEFLRENQVRRMILISTGGAMYGNKHLAKEDDVISVADLNGFSPYAYSKLMAERFTQIYQSEPGKSWVVLRLANVFGGDYSVRGEAAVHAHFAQDDPITVYGGDQTRDFIHINAVCQAIKRSITLGHGIYNIGSGVNTHIANLAESYGAMREVSVNYEPARPGEVQHISLDCTKAIDAGLLGNLEDKKDGKQ